jgi:hypothetical protein
MKMACALFVYSIVSAALAQQVPISTIDDAEPNVGLGSRIAASIQDLAAGNLDD